MYVLPVARSVTRIDTRRYYFETNSLLLCVAPHGLLPLLTHSIQQSRLKLPPLLEIRPPLLQHTHTCTPLQNLNIIHIHTYVCLHTCIPRCITIYMHLWPREVHVSTYIYTLICPYTIKVQLIIFQPGCAIDMHVILGTDGR